MELTLDTVSLRRGDFTLTADIALMGPGLRSIIGPSGGGKSTFLALIAGFVRPDAGRVVFSGEDISETTPGARPVAMLFQDNNLFPHLDILTNVALGTAPVARPGSEAKDRARAAMDRVGLRGFEGRKPTELSGGQQSRAALARVLLTNRPIVLMDEPFAALGPAQRQDMHTLVAELLPNAMVLMVTHDPTDAQKAFETLLVVDGEVHTPQNTRALFQNPPEALGSYLGEK